MPSDSHDLPLHAPEPLQSSFERLWLDTTEPLDQLLALKLVQLVRQTVEIAYAMGYQDGQDRCPGLPPLS
ncbi:MAG: hypothetical protein KME03_15215 [Aphanocapsa lilacina HA4352-LM1]|jgi:hypothetical protein|uniref:Gsl3194 protein n=2 Tax=Gloeobacter TaxID=33071 RepID=Q7NGH5_GLOVI|nr:MULTISPECIES: hypothetical protein [Gloeobacter]MBW4699214.1 hypothetical protein [Aphanocapsa lilacina HA4352-LM1]UFP96380.1 hypothetical protein ISF26_09290 [Gloeobacter morelensis MG652769]BAC91135.1 gsl3194 [Gloeobacter violaceus PCC 7421]